MDEATEREHIRLAVEVQQKVVGSRPLGIYQVHIFLFFVCLYGRFFSRDYCSSSSRLRLFSSDNNGNPSILARVMRFFRD